MPDIDKPGIPPEARINSSPPLLKTYTAPAGNAAETAKVLQEVYKDSPTLRITAIGNTQIMVYAPPSDQIDIARMILGSVPDQGHAYVFFLQESDAKQIADMMAKRFPAPPGPNIEADTSRNAVIILGTDDQIKEVKDTIKAIVGNDIISSGGDREMRMFNLDKGGAVLAGPAPGGDVQEDPAGKPRAGDHSLRFHQKLA